MKCSRIDCVSWLKLDRADNYAKEDDNERG